MHAGNRTWALGRLPWTLNSPSMVSGRLSIDLNYEGIDFYHTNCRYVMEGAKGMLKNIRRKESNS